MKKYAKLLGAVLLAFLSVLSHAQAPVPFINLPLVPDATAPGGGDFTLTVNGTGFVSNSVVNWNGAALATQFVNHSRLKAVVPAADIAANTTGSVTVFNPAPGGGTSNVAFFTVALSSGKSLEFAPASTLNVGPLFRSLATGDFNGDGKLDLVVPNWIYDGAVSILLGDGAGNFTSASYPAGCHYPNAVAVGDFNGDGKLDLVVAASCQNSNPSCVFILLGDGAGAFTLVSSAAVGDTAEAIAVGDFNGDGKLDLAVVNQFGNSLSILLGDGTGNFTLASSPATGASPRSAAVGDFNRDGNLDLAVVNSYPFGGGDTVSILLGDGTGNFTLASSPSTGGFPSSVAAADFNGDGKLDLAIANLDGGVSILLGDGAGNFTLASSPAAGFEPTSVAVGDFNGDGKLDLVVSDTDQYRGNTVSILLGDGKGNFTQGPPFAVGNDPGAIVVGDFNGDGNLDLATANQSDNTVSILLRVPPVSTADLSPASLVFGPQIVDTMSVPQTATLTNNGITLAIASVVIDNPNFLKRTNCRATLSPGRSCTIQVALRPHTIGTVAGTLTVTDSAGSSPQTVSLTGEGTAVTLLPSTLNFGGQPVGTASPPQVVTLTNYSRRAIIVHHIVLTETNGYVQTNNCGTSVPAGGSCTISVVFAPPNAAPRWGTLKVYDDGGDSPQKVTLYGYGT